MDASTIIPALLGAVIGTLSKIYIPAFLEGKKYNRRKEFFGKWYSAYQSLDNESKWIDEEVVIDLHWKRFRIRNSANEVNYDYVGLAELVEQTYLKGKYKSNRPGANSFGAFVLCIAPQGNMLYGYWIGPNDKGERRFSGWVIGRTMEDVQAARKILAETTLFTPEYH